VEVYIEGGKAGQIGQVGKKRAAGKTGHKARARWK
jgi:hypothetical protein